MAQWYRRSRLVRIAGWLGLGAIALILLAWIIVETWLIPRAVEKMTHHLARAGIHLDFGEADLKVLHGRLQLTDLTLYRAVAKNDPLLFLSDVRMRIDLGQLIFDRTLWGEGRIRDGKLIFYGDHHHSIYEDLDLDFNLDINQLWVLKLDCRGLGYQVDGTAHVRWGSDSEDIIQPGASTASEPSTTASTPMEVVAEKDPYPEFPGEFGWMESLSDLFYCEARGPELAKLSLHLEWDQTIAPALRADGSEIPNSQLKVAGSVHGNDVIWLNLPLESLDSEFEIVRGEVRIPRAEFVGMKGRFASAGSYDIDTSRLTFSSPVSTMDPHQLLGNLGIIDPSLIASIEFGDSMPTLRGDELSIDFNEPSKPIVAITIEAPDGFKYREEPGSDEAMIVDRFKGSFDYRQQGELLIHDIEGRSGGLDLSGRFQYLWEAEPPSGDTGGGGDGEQASSSQAGDEPADPRPAASPSKPTSSLSQVVNRVLQFESTGDTAPSCAFDVVWDDTHVSGSADNISSYASIKGSFTGSDFKWHGHPIDLARVDVSVADQSITVNQLELSGLRGTMKTSGKFDLQQRVLTIPSLESTLDIAELKSGLGIQLDPTLDSIRFPSPPNLVGRELEIHFDDPSANRGQLEILAENGLTVGEGEESLAAQSLKVVVDWQGMRELKIEEASATMGGLEIETSGIFRWKDAVSKPELAEGVKEKSPAPPSGSSIDPVNKTDLAAAQEVRDSSAAAMIAWIREWLIVEAKASPARLTAQFEWDEDRIATQPQGRAPSALDGLVLNGELSGNDCVWRDISITRLESKFAVADSRFKFTPFGLETRDGRINARGSFDSVRSRLLLDSIEMNLDLQTLLHEFSDGSSDLLTRISFPGSPQLKGKNLDIDFADAKQTRGSLEIQFPDGIELLAENRNLVLENVRGTLMLENGIAEASNLEAQILGGIALVKLRAAVSGDTPWYEISIAVQEVSMDALSTWLQPDDKKQHPGNFDLQFAGNGVGRLDAMVGDGRVIVDSDAPVAQNFPVLDGLIGFLEGLIPGLKKKKNWTLNMPFSVKEAIISLNNAKLKGPSIDLSVNGTIDLNSEMVNVGVGVNLRGLLGVTTSVLTLFRENLVDITGTGKLGAVEWKKGGLLKKPTVGTETDSKQPERKRRGILRRR